MILVSACLAGINCKYNGSNNYDEKIFNLVKEGRAIPVCAEQLGGLETPRIPSEIKYINSTRFVVNKNNIDVTDKFEKGAKEILELAKKMNIKRAILKSRSPSCGVGEVYSGNFDNKLVKGNGVLADLLLKNDIEVIRSDEITDNML